jgi:hypothetical protein
VPPWVVGFVGYSFAVSAEDSARVSVAKVATHTAVDAIPVLIVGCSEGERPLLNFLGKSETDRLARLAGILYLLVLPTAGPWYYTSAAMLGGNAATLATLEAGRRTLEVVILLGAVGHTLQLLAAMLLYRLLSPFGKMAASLTLILLAVSVPLSFAAIARETDLLALLDRAQELSALGAAQLQAQITLTADAYTSLAKTAAFFWGLWLFPLGWVLWRSRYVPRVIAACVMLGGPLYVQAFVGPLFDLNYATSLVSSVIGFVSGIPDLIGEIGVALWLTVIGARSGRRATLAAE